MMELLEGRIIGCYPARSDSSSSLQRDKNRVIVRYCGG